MLCVGTYGPHPPYVAPRELYGCYLDKVSLPEETFAYADHPAPEGRIMRERDPEVVRAARAAYYGLVEFEDQQVGKVYDAYQAYLKRTGREVIFVYVSDHGEQIGYRGYFGKSTFYDASSHIPMLFIGDGIQKGRRLHGAASLMDLGPTLCELTGASPVPKADGVSLVPQLTGGADDLERMVLAEVDGALVEKMRASLAEACRPVEQIREQAENPADNLTVLSHCNHDSDSERRHCPERARHYPDPMVKSHLSK